MLQRRRCYREQEGGLERSIILDIPKAKSIVQVDIVDQASLDDIAGTNGAIKDMYARRKPFKSINRDVLKRHHDCLALMS